MCSSPLESLIMIFLYIDVCKCGSAEYQGTHVPGCGRWDSLGFTCYLLNGQSSNLKITSECIAKTSAQLGGNGVYWSKKICTAGKHAIAIVVIMLCKLSEKTINKWTI